MNRPKVVDVVWLVENVPREMDTACVVKVLAEQKYAISVIIRGLYFGIRDTLARFKPKAVVIPHCYKGSVPGLRHFVARWPEAIYFNLAWEELYYNANLPYKAPADEFARNHVIHHGWGEFYRDYLLQYSVPQKHIYINGQPAYKLYDEPYSRYFLAREALARQFGLSPDRRWIFFPENYLWAAYSEKTIKAIIEYGQDPEAVYVMRDFCRDARTTALEWCAALAEKAPVEVIVRPRPYTVDEMKRVVKRTIPRRPKNMHVIEDGTVREWIMASNVVISSHSTSLIEAAVAGKSAYMLEPYPIPEPLYANWYENITKIKSFEEFETACLGVSGATQVQAFQHWARVTLLSHGDPIANLADFIGKLCRGEVERPPVPPTEILPPVEEPPKDPSTLRRAYQQLRRHIGRLLKPDEVLGFEPVIPFSYRDVKRRVRQWKRVLNDQLPQHLPESALVDVESAKL